MQNYVTVRRLNRLKTAILNRPKIVKHFNMNYFAIEDFGASKGTDFCGTAACALGTAGFTPYFRKLGLKSHPKHNCVEYVAPNGQRLSGFNAGAAFFGIEYYESYHLFAPGPYGIPAYTITPQMVAERVDELIASYQIPTRNP